MVCLGLEPGAAGWNAQTNPLSYGGTQKLLSITVRLVSSLTGLDWVVSVHTKNKIFSCLVKSNPVKLDTNRTVILPPTVKVFWTSRNDEIVHFQLLVGIPLEIVHGSMRLILIYTSGVLAGSVSASVFDSSVHLAGAGGGVFALLSAHLSNIILHYASMSRPRLQCLGLLTLASFEVGFGIYRRFQRLPQYTKELHGWGQLDVDVKLTDGPVQKL